MEFFEEINQVNLSVRGLQDLLTIKDLAYLCKSIDCVILDHKISGVVYCLWGEFKVNREVLKHGIRFTMPECPNALAWTITIDTDRALTLHFTINKKTHDPDFVESIFEFVREWKKGLSYAVSKEHYLLRTQDVTE